MPRRNPPTIDEAWLRKLKPRDELVARYALRGLSRRSGGAGADKAFSDRIEELRVKLDLDENGYAAVLREVEVLQKKMTGHIEADAERSPATRRKASKRDR